jgi:3-phenylpropionate/trans-cinnamate dioxygenase ferredoxin reductase component
VTLRNVVVVGGSIAALTAAETLRVRGFDGHVTVVSDESQPPYTRVPLSKGVLAGEQSVDSVSLGTVPADIDLRLTERAQALDLDRRVVVTTAGEVHYDGLVIATGARARRIGSASQRERVLRDTADAVALTAALGRSESVIVVGGGFLGMEIASTCVAAARCAVTVVDLAPPLDRLLGPEVARHVRDCAAHTGVRFVVTSGGVRLVGEPEPTAVATADGRRLQADLVVSAVGDLPNVSWLEGSGLALAGGVVVDERCRAAPGVVAAGDVAVRVDGLGSVERIPSWTNAVEQARAAAVALLLGDEAPVYRPSRYAWTEQFGLDIKTVGPGAPIGPGAVLQGGLDTGSALLAWPDATEPRQVTAVNHHLPVATLKRLVRR